jgi:hypothetical protein
MWKGGRSTIKSGYVYVMLQPDDPFYCMTQTSGYVFEHRLVMAKYLGRPLREWETVHHKDNDKSNNDITNLQLRIGKHGKGVSYRCMNCGSDKLEPVTLD